MPTIGLSILNQRQTPAFYADVFANRPAAGFVGRIFVSTDTFAFYRDNGTGWDLIGGPGTGTVTGSGAAGQVAFWSGASLISGENNLWWDSANNHLGINTNTPATALDVNHNGTLVAKFNNTTTTSTLLAFENAGNEQWWIGTENTNNDFLFYDATNFPTLSLRTTFKTSGQVLIGGGSTGSGLLVVESAASDNGIQIVGASAPSLRIDNAASGPTKRAGLGISTAVNNFIQGSADRDFCIFNGSTTASPILFGVYDAGLTNVQEAVRISAARNFLIGTNVDSGEKLIISTNAKIAGISGSVLFTLGNTSGGTLSNFTITENVGLIIDTTDGGTARSVDIKIGGNSALLIATSRAATFSNSITATQLNTSSISAGNLIGGFFTNSNQSGTADSVSLNFGLGRTVDNIIFNISAIKFGKEQQWTGTGSTIDGYLSFSTILNENVSEVARFSSNGNFLIGTVNNGGSKLRIVGLPTSAAGLSSGDIYSNAGILTIVP